MMSGVDPNSAEAAQMRSDLTNTVNMLRARYENGLGELPAAERAKLLISISESLNRRAMVETGADSNATLQEALEAVREAVREDESIHEGHFQLGSVLNMLAFSTTQRDAALRLFDEATQCFERAVELAPDNRQYQTYLDNMPQAPQIWDQIMAQMHMHEGGHGMAMMEEQEEEQQPLEPEKPKERAKRRENLKYHILATAIVGAAVYYAFKSAWGGDSALSQPLVSRRSPFSSQF